MFFLDRKNFGIQLSTLLKDSLYKILIPAFTILLLICFTQLIAKSLSENISSLTASINQSWQIVVQPVIGIIGSFITGSATMSNLLFAGSLSGLTLTQQPLLTAMLHTGSAVGNAISLQNIIMVKSVVPENISESRILKFNLPVVGFYVALVVLSALIYTSCRNI